LGRGVTVVVVFIFTRSTEIGSDVYWVKKGRGFTWGVGKGCGHLKNIFCGWCVGIILSLNKYY
jgi:hypothetical protein